MKSIWPPLVDRRLLTMAMLLCCGMLGCSRDTGGDLGSVSGIETDETLQQLEDRVGAKSRIPTAQDLDELRLSGETIELSKHPNSTVHLWRADDGRIWMIAYVAANGLVHDLRVIKFAN